MPGLTQRFPIQEVLLVKIDFRELVQAGLDFHPAGGATGVGAAAVEDVHPGVLLDGEDQPLALLDVERARTFHLDAELFSFREVAMVGGSLDMLSTGVRTPVGVKVMGIPKTMDNDVQGTEYCVGFSTAITRATAAIDRQRTTIGSHERVGIFRVFGRDAGGRGAGWAAWR